MNYVRKHIEEQWPELLKYYPDAELTYVENDWHAVVSYTEKKVPAHWGKESLHIRFNVPLGYPVVAPKRFWVKERVVNGDGIIPMYASETVDPLGESRIGFWWRVERWNPNRDHLIVLPRIMKQRLAIYN